MSKDALRLTKMSRNHRGNERRNKRNRRSFIARAGGIREEIYQLGTSLGEVSPQLDEALLQKKK